ncbi:MAG TPA: MFS transporter [Nitrososphaerales archaeon]|nr:MFS transporter [Nitrososphaerales archaeon]
MDRNTLAAAMSGSAVAWYSWFLFSSGAIYISTTFLPPGDQVTSITDILGVFAAGFLVRPLGALAFGHYGDTRGRRKMLILTVILISASSATIGLLPGYSQLGNAAIIPVIAAYLLLGFSLGGEWVGSILLMMENAPEGERASRSAYAQATIGIGLLLGSVAYVMLGGIISSGDMLAYGWRIPFIITLPLGFVALALRFRISETRLFESVETSGQVAKLPLAGVVGRHKRKLILGTLIVGSSGTAFYTGAVLFPVVFELLKVVTIQSGQVGIATMAAAEIAAVFAGGAISDRAGRKPMIWATNLGLLALVYPAFYFQNGAAFFICMALFGLTHGIAYAPIGTTISEVFPTNIRASGSSLTYQLGNTLIAGPASFISVLLGTVAFWLYPAYTIIWALVALGAVSIVPETRDSTLE